MSLRGRIVTVMATRDDMARSFGAAAEAYDSGRPDYPADAVAWLLEHAGERPRVADVGAGTGKLTRVVQRLAGEVIAVEPDAAMLDRLRAAGAPAVEGFLVQERVRGVAELILGFHRDPQLGPVILLGAGGVAAEVFQDATLRLLPISRSDAEAMVDELKSARLLRGYRGAAPADVAAVVDAVLAFAAMAQAAGDRLLEAEINPLFVLPEGQGVRAADGLAVLG